MNPFIVNLSTYYYRICVRYRKVKKYEFLNNKYFFVKLFVAMKCRLYEAMSVKASAFDLDRTGRLAAEQRGSVASDPHGARFDGGALKRAAAADRRAATA